jgi:hypothetical protein
MSNTRTQPARGREDRDSLEQCARDLRASCHRFQRAFQERAIQRGLRQSDTQSMMRILDAVYQMAGTALEGKAAGGK